MPFMLVEEKEDEEIVNETHYFYNLSSAETEIALLLSVATVFIICCYSLNGCRQINNRRKEDDFYEEIKDPTVYSVI